MTTNPRPIRWMTTVGLTLVFGVLLYRTAWLCDDAYITLRTVDNFLRGYGPNWNVAERLQTYTHPLWFLLLSGLVAMTHEMYLTVIVTSMVLSAAAFLLVVGVGSRSGYGALAGGLALILAPGFVSFSTSGMENALSFFLAGLFAVLLLGPDANRRRSGWLGGVAGALVVNRFDLAILVLPALVAEMIRTRRLRVLLFFLAPVVAWSGFAIVYYGFLLPNSAYAKLSTGVGHGAYIRQGLVYFRDAVQRETLMVVLTAVAAILAAVLGNGRRRAIACGTVLYAVYIVWIGGDFMRGRFLTVPFLLAITILMDADYFLRGVWRAAAIGVVLVTAFAGGVPSVFSGRDFDETAKDRRFRQVHGITDERAYYFQRHGLRNGAPLRSRIGHDMAGLRREQAKEPARIKIIKTAGTHGLRSGPAAHLIDLWGLGDALMARLPVKSAHWRIGHFRREIPSGYLLTVLKGENLVEDASLAEYYSHLRRITRGPVFGARRWRSIVAMNLGRCKNLVHADYKWVGTDEYVAFVATDLTAGGQRILRGAAKAYCDQGDFAGMEPILRRFAELNITTRDVYIGEILGCARRHARSDPAFSEAVYRLLCETEPDNPLPSYQFGIFLQEHGRADEAAKMFESPVDGSPR